MKSAHSIKLFFVSIAVVFFAAKEYAQTTKVFHGDTITSEFTFWKKNEYKPHTLPKFRLSCINKEGDTLSLTEYIGIKFKYPKSCIEMGLHAYHMWYRVVLDPKGKLKNIEAIRPEYCKEAISEQLTAILNGLQKILSKKETEFVIEMRIKVIPMPPKEMPAPKAIEIRR